MNQYFPALPNPKNKAPFYKDLEPEGMSYEDALEEINSILSNNYNLQINWSFIFYQVLWKCGRSAQNLSILFKDLLILWTRPQNQKMST